MTLGSRSNIFVVVGTPGSGKDVLIQAVNDLGVLHARIVPKHTSRKRERDDGAEMICKGDVGYDLEGCDIQYSSYTDRYGIKSVGIWNNIKEEIAQVMVVSEIRAINNILSTFGDLVKLIFVHSEMNEDKFENEQVSAGKSEEYIKNRVAGYKSAEMLYYKNILQFDHVLIYADSDEDLFDQIFRLFQFYETTY